MAEPAYEDIFQRNYGIYTNETQELLRNSCIGMAGLGLGSATALALARNGVGKLKLADLDKVAVHNMNRQPVATTSTIGLEKVLVAESLLKGVNPHLELELYRQGVTAANAREFVAGCDIVVDGIDYYAPGARQELHKQARAQGKHAVMAVAGGFGGLVMNFSPTGPTMEEVLGYPTDPELAGSYQVPDAKMMGCLPSYLSALFYQMLQKPENPYPPSNGATVMIAGGAAAIQAVKTLVYIDQNKHPGKHQQFGSISITTMPFALRLDGWDEQYSRVFNIMDAK